MNWTMIKQLIRKDWQFNRNALVLYTLIGFLAVGLLTLSIKGAFYTGVVLIISAVIVVGAHLIFVTVLMERKEQNLAFIMSLPVSFMEYTTAKLLFNIGAFSISWILLYISTLIAIIQTDTIDNGFLPFATIALIELFVAYVIVLGIAVITESEAWTIVTITVSNISVSLFWYFLGSFEEISNYTNAESPVWNSTAITFIAAEITIILLMISLVFYFQSRKHDFL